DTDPNDDEVPGQADMGAIKTLLALRRIPGALQKNHVVVELLDGERRGVMERIGVGGVEVVSMTEVLGRLLVQTVRQSGIAEVYRYLLSYDGSEFYFHPFPELAGQPWSVVQWRLENAVAVGIRRIGADGKINVILNPRDEEVLQQTDEILVLAEDDDTFRLVAERAVTIPANFKGTTPRGKQPESILIVGVGENLSDILSEFDTYVAKGSKVYLLPGRTQDELKDEIDTSKLNLKNTSLHFIEGDPTSPEVLRPLRNLDLAAAMVVADMRFDDQEADARTAMSVLLLREIFEDAGKKVRIISEMLDPRTKELLEGDGAADFVVSTEITSMLLAQVSERRELNAVFADLFDSDGNEIYFKRSAAYAPLGQNVSWLQVQKVARARGEIALGYYRDGQPFQMDQMNPPQDLQLAFSEADKVIVLAEDDREEPYTQTAPPEQKSA
ncbi:MAG: CASTOR/POLLUX-related putative ion channel, partial [Myxococcaceae bacterium]